MLSRLRVKFIALNMTIAVLVLGVAFCTVCYLDYRAGLDAVYEALDATLDRVVADHRADPMPEGSGAAGQGASEGVDSGGSESADNQGAAPKIGERPDDGAVLIPVAVYYLHDDGTYEAAGGVSTARVSDETVEDAIASASSSSESRGFLASLGLYFAKRTAADVTVIVYADAGTAASWEGLAWALTGVGLAALAVLLLINVLFSRWALKPVERAWDQQRQFVADASHELKTPLTVILANSAILRSRSDSTIAEQEQWIAGTQAEAERMQGLVGDLLDLARLSEDASERRAFEAVDMGDLVEGAVLQFESVAFERGLRLESDLERGVCVKGDPERLRRLVSSLLDNACKYADEGGEVSVGLRRLARSVQVEVRNSGEPIPPDDLPHVFDRFYRVDKARTADGDARGGYGLGLAIAHDIAVGHGGSLQVASTAELGTVFTVSLPCADRRR